MCQKLLVAGLDHNIKEAQNETKRLIKSTHWATLRREKNPYTRGKSIQTEPMPKTNLFCAGMSSTFGAIHIPNIPIV